MQHYPKIVFGDVQHSANLLAVNVVPLLQTKRRADILGQLARTIVKGFPESLVVQAPLVLATIPLDPVHESSPL